ncbi:helix-turn-helix domain-containing protein [Bacillus idriensis]|uniref:Helix-turn-helix domain-containing protein n=1 Tax=Metabacillus idriensis TaxID=324768 RepID=A0A6I2M4A8_9BACI|nr:helix-turn-helix domain-containing protein [Metabacillus idriensis]MRX52928.1 helix-turn-helix domain-containing protein [Metabacillus idriensis]
MDKNLIKKIRLVFGLKQAEIAERIGKTQAYIALLEAGSIPLKKEVEMDIKRAFHSEGVTETDMVILHELGKGRANEKNTF